VAIILGCDCARELIDPAGAVIQPIRNLSFISSCGEGNVHPTRGQSRAVTADGAVTLQASSQLMDDFVFATDLRDDTALVPVQQADGYSLLYIGLAGNVMALRPDPESDTGWIEDQLATGFAAQKVVGAVDRIGQLAAFATGPNVAAPDIRVATREADGRWSAWRLLAVDASVPPFMQVTNLAACTIAGVVELFVTLAPSPGRFGPAGVWRVDWRAAAPVWHYLSDTDSTTLAACDIAGIGPSLMFARRSARPTTFDLMVVPAPFDGPPKLLAGELWYTDLSVATQADGRSAIFLADNGHLSDNRSIRYLDGGNPTNGFVVIDNTLLVNALAGASAGLTLLGLFVLDADGTLQILSSSESGWEPAFNLELRFSSILCAVNAVGAAELLGYAPSSGLLRLWRSPATAEGGAGWTQAAVRYMPKNTSLRQQSTYATTLAFYGSDGLPLRDETVHLRSTEIMSANVAGEVRVVGPDRPLPCRTDGQGRVRVTTPTRALNVAELSARIPALMTGVSDFHVTPNAAVRDSMRKISVEEVRKLIPAKYAPDAENIQKAVQETMKALHDGPVALATMRVAPPTDLKAGIALGAAPPRAFQFRVANGRAMFEELTESEFETVRASLRQGQTPSPLFPGLHIFENIVEAVGNAVKNGVDVAYHWAIEVKDGISVTLCLVIGGIEHIFDGPIKSLQDGFRLVESVFSAVGTFFKDLYEFLAWLLSDARKAIWATKGQFESFFNQAITMLADAARNSSGLSHEFFLGVERQVDELFAQIERRLHGITFGEAAGVTLADGSSQTILEILNSAAAAADWLWDKLSSALFGSIDIDIKIVVKIAEEAVELLKELGLAIGKEITDQIDALIESLIEFTSSVSELSKVALSVLLAEAKNVMLAVLRVLDAVTRAFLKFIADALPTLNEGILNAPINNWLMQKLYDLINPGRSEPLTVLGLGALLCAFPATVLYRALFGKPPFPTEISTTLAQPEDTLAGVCLQLSGVLQAVPWARADYGIDLGQLENQPVVALSLLIVMPTLMQVLAWPGGPGTVPSFDSRAKIALWTAWFVGFLSPALVFAWGLTTKFKQGPRGNKGGSVALCVFGVSSLGCNIWSAVENDVPVFAWIAATAAPFSGIAKPLKFVKPYGPIALAVFDIVSDFAAGAAKFMVAWDARRAERG
jgi:hypothetical protein